MAGANGKYNQEIANEFLEKSWPEYQAIPSHGASWKFDPFKIFIDNLVKYGKVAIACAHAGIAESTLYAWQNENDNNYRTEFIEVLKKGRALWASNKLDSLESKGTESWQADAWMLERILPDEFKEHKQTDADIKATNTLTQILKTAQNAGTEQAQNDPLNAPAT